VTRAWCAGEAKRSPARRIPLDPVLEGVGLPVGVHRGRRARSASIAPSSSGMAICGPTCTGCSPGRSPPTPGGLEHQRQGHHVGRFSFEKGLDARGWSWRAGHRDQGEAGEGSPPPSTQRLVGIERVVEESFDGLWRNRSRRRTPNQRWRRDISSSWINRHVVRLIAGDECGMRCSTDRSPDRPGLLAEVGAAGVPVQIP